ncbi:MAG: hypothetical protein AcusKO_44350 [Acuticoccus sp.]
MIKKSEDDAGNGWLLFHLRRRFPGQAEAIKAELAGFTDVWTALDQRRWGFLDGKRREALSLWSGLFGAREDMRLRNRERG